MLAQAASAPSGIESFGDVWWPSLTRAAHLFVNESIGRRSGCYAAKIPQPNMQSVKGWKASNIVEIVHNELYFRFVLNRFFSCRLSYLVSWKAYGPREPRTHYSECKMMVSGSTHLLVSFFLVARLPMNFRPFPNEGPCSKSGDNKTRNNTYTSRSRVEVQFDHLWCLFDVAMLT